ncbi:MAG: DCC1-like thiol-disulfide oxidoreductase family protein [Chthoniobacter sp.]
MSQYTVLYDGDCPMCVFQMKALSWLDWFGVLALIPLSDPRARKSRRSSPVKICRKRSTA